ncbi:exonuclease subunit SbcC [Paradesulfitobacterium aromaticivorans]
MKPLRLQIVGLNSFREKQEIDFTQLCETGVFGIFGQTGSGKSTILDAITLALYGTVERAANNTQGILNHAEDVLSVKYTFTLGLGAERTTYRVERSYRRSGERTVKAAVCRLVEISAGSEKVLASKAEEVTQNIEELLGLTAEDFTRAVVLPQGKFAEFLTIKPKDRRQMLERLFALEAYGKELTAKLSERLDNTKFTLNGVEQRQQGLGDASAERVEEAEKEFNRASTAVALVGQELETRKQQFETDKEVWNLQLELDQIREREKELKTREQATLLLSERLELAERAELIRPVIEELNQAQTRLQEALTKAEGAEGKLESARRGQEDAEIKWSKAFRKKTENEPLLQRRLEQVEQAKGLVQEIQERSAKLIQLREDYKKMGKVKEGLEQEIHSVIEEKARTQSTETEFKQRLREIVIEPSRRTQVHAAAKALDAYEMIDGQTGTLQQDLSANEEGLALLQSQLGEAEKYAGRCEVLVEDLKGQLSDFQQNPPAIEESLGERAQETERFRALLANIERAEIELAEAKERIKRSEEESQGAHTEVARLEAESEVIFQSLQAAALARAEKAGIHKELEQNNLAAILRQGLIEGESCPVCGSSHHPNPVEHIDDEALARAKAELEQVEQELQALEGQRTAVSTQLAVAQAGLKGKADNLGRFALEADGKLKQVKDYRDSLNETDRTRAVAELKGKLALEESDLAATRLAWNAWKEEQEQKVRRLDALQGDLTAAVAKAAQARTQVASITGVGQEIRTRLEKLLAERTRKQKDLDAVRGDIPVPDILLLQERYAAWDRETAEIGQNLIKLERELKVLEQKREDLLQKKNGCELTLQDLMTAGREAAQAVSELQAKLEGMIGKQDAEELLESIGKELQDLQSAEKLTKEALEQAQKALVQAQQEQAVLAKERELKQEALDAAQSRLAQGLKDAQFLTVAAAQSALCDVSEREKMKAEIKAYQQELVSAQDRRSQVEEKLKGRTLAPEVWVAWPVRLKQAEQEHANAVESRGAAHTNLSRLKEQHGEWLKLEADRLALTHKYNLLKKLQAVFKGNSFVEFVAEEQLMTVALDASERLGQLTNHRYALEVDSEGGFIMRDDANGGAHRPVSSLSGGETFLTSLALALALSTQIQLRGEVPLEFFFLDEGFGTLDPSLLEVVMNTLEKLRLQNLTIGIISHVPELKNRLARRLIVTSAEPGGAGSKVKLELA